MGLLSILIQLVAVTVLSLVLAAVFVLDEDDLRRARREFRSRLLIGLPGAGLLGGILLINARFRTRAEDWSQTIGVRITAWIRGIEEPVVPTIQQVLLHEWLEIVTVPFFSIIYIHGYVFLLVFPLVAYFTLDRMDVFQEVTIAYAANYAIGIVCYIAFIAYGPRNAIPEIVATPLYTEFPQFKLLTSVVNENTNVFPSLHTSLSATVILFAWRTRTEIPRWTPIAMFLGVSIMIATMFLAIHWLIDVIAGIGLALVSARIGIEIVERGYLTDVGTSLHRFTNRTAD